ncbi:MAG: 2-succinyl-6-hydroxy-2,4-cyclohexadiene-carboxylate synthase [Proteobacteria bacterium]|nr:2-succinyl-6-hydroxy-2,4-cyclohexadiene-carboxylate synthase [Pseudomonadota bacterium]
MTDIGTLNFTWSQAIIGGFVAAGITDAVISPGSRSTPLALAMLRQAGLRCHIAIDERSAAFFGLGLAKSRHCPVLLLATSGTAPANWLPAVIEASQSGIPLILISADRPPELQDCGANQTVSQPGLFGSHTRASHTLGTPEPGFNPGYLHRVARQACEQASWPHPGPVHINQPFREPMLPSEPVLSGEMPEKISISHPDLQPDLNALGDLTRRISGRPGIIVCGEMQSRDGQNEALVALAARLRCPIFAEPLSGLRFGPHDRSHLCVRYNDWLGKTDLVSQYRPEWVIRFGAYPVTRNLQKLVSEITETHALVDPWPRWIDPARRLTHLLRSEPAAICKALLDLSLVPFSETWLSALGKFEGNAEADEKRNHIHVLLEEVPDDTDLFVGNSLAIRQMDTHSGSADKTLRIYANRGASGIDGNISTAAGIAASRGRAVALIGDLTCQHDLGGLALAQGQNIVIIVVNNGGGGIFDHLPQRDLPEFTQGWRTPQNVNFEHAALAFGLGYAAADSDDDLRPALRHAFAAGGPHLIELRQC